MLDVGYNFSWKSRLFLEVKQTQEVCLATAMIIYSNMINVRRLLNTIGKF